jgi:transposase
MGRDAKYVVRLTDDERTVLESLVKAPRAARAKVLRARMLLKADVDGLAWTDAQIVVAFDVSESTVHRLRQRLVEHGFEAALERQPPTRTKSRRLDGAGEARLVAVACSAAPAGRVRWTLQLLADKLVELGVTDSVCPETVRQTLKKTNSSPGSSSSGSFPPTAAPSSSAQWKTR